jgi:hypothetical protein
LTFWCQGWILDPFIIIFYFVRLPLCNKYSDYIVTFISIHSIVIYVVFFGACMRCTWLCPLKPGVLQLHTTLPGAEGPLWPIMAQAIPKKRSAPAQFKTLTHCRLDSTVRRGRPRSLVRVARLSLTASAPSSVVHLSLTAERAATASVR